MKRLVAILTAVVMTGVIALGMLVVGVSAMMNPNSIPVADSADAPAAVAQTTTTSDPQAAAQINQLNSLITQYQDREKQYQTQIGQLNQEVQQMQSVLQQLQRQGVIRINRDGTIQLRRDRDD